MTTLQTLTRYLSRRGRCIGAALGALIAAHSGLAAQERRITVQNLAPIPRLEWVSAVVPFAKGQVRTQPALHVKGSPTVWQPFGARYDDGSVRQAHCMFRCELGSLDEKSLTLVSGPGPAWQPEPFGVMPYSLSIVVEQGDSRIEVEPRLRELLEDNPVRKVAVLRERIGKTGLVAEITMTSYAGQQHVYVGVGVFYSDPSTKKMEVKVSRVTVASRGMALFLRHEGPLGAHRQMTQAGSEIELLHDVRLGDGQGVRRSGVLVPPLLGRSGTGADRNNTLRAATLCPPLAATSWVGTGAFGAFGVVPNPPSWLRGPALRRVLAKRHEQFVSSSRTRSGDPFRHGDFQLGRYPGQTGNQNDFGVVALEPIAYSGLPSMLFEVELSILQEACRPTHFFELDATPVKASNHPDWVVWTGRTHRDPVASKDRLGKPNEEVKFESHGWSGKDRQHWTANNLCAYYLLTGDPMTLLEIRNEVQLYLAEQTLRDGLATSGPGHARAIGRTLSTGCWLYLCTGDDDLLQRMRERVRSVYSPHWRERGIASGDGVCPITVMDPAGSVFGGRSQFWMPWQESIAAVGLFAYYRLTEDEVALDIARGIATNTLKFGWRTNASGFPVVGYAMAYGDPTPLSPTERSSEEFATWSSGGLSEWSLGALEIARQAADAAGDEQLAARATDYLRKLRAGRRRPPDGFYDRFSRWDAVR